MKKIQIFCTLILVTLLTACTGLSSAANKGVDASDDELLATLASLARRGTTAVCDPAVLEQELGIRFGEFKIDKPDSAAARQIQREYIFTDEVSPISKSKIIEYSRFIRTKGTDSASCQIYVHFLNKRLCDVTSPHVQKIMGVPLAITPSIPHRSDSANVYAFEPINGKSSSISLGISSQKCASDFVLTVIAEK